MEKMRRIEILIGACAECPYCQPKFVDSQIMEKCYYKDNSKEVPDSDTIPDWCQLEEVEKC